MCFRRHQNWNATLFFHVLGCINNTLSWSINSSHASYLTVDNTVFSCIGLHKQHFVMVHK